MTKWKTEMPWRNKRLKCHEEMKDWCVMKKLKTKCYEDMKDWNAMKTWKTEMLWRCLVFALKAVQFHISYTRKNYDGDTNLQ